MGKEIYCECGVEVGLGLGHSCSSELNTLKCYPLPCVCSHVWTEHKPICHQDGCSCVRYKDPEESKSDQTTRKLMGLSSQELSKEVERRLGVLTKVFDSEESERELLKDAYKIVLGCLYGPIGNSIICEDFCRAAKEVLNRMEIKLTGKPQTDRERMLQECDDMGIPG